MPAAIADRLLPFADHLALQGGIGALGPVVALPRRAEAAAGRTADAEEHLRQAVATSERHGFRPALAKSRLALARLLAERGELAAAAEEAAKAREVADDVGMLGVSREAERLTHE